MDPAEDILGLSHEARGGSNRGLCLALVIALNDQLVAQGIVGRPAELQRRYGAVMAGRRVCPLRGSCRRYQGAADAGKRFVGEGPRQLPLPLL